MKAMILKDLCRLEENPSPLEMAELPDPVPEAGQILVRITACGVCHTELDEIEGRTPPPRLPVVPGHQIVGRVVGNGDRAGSFQIGERVGIAWIYSACGVCRYCREGQENLCADFQATGRDVDGGYAQYLAIPEGFAHRIPPEYTDSEAAPLLCAGAIGYRSLRLTNLNDGGVLGLVGFGASGHLVLQLARYQYPNSEIYVHARNPREREYALELGAAWAGEIGQESPTLLDCLIDTTPVWKPVLAGLENLKPGGRLVINAIRKEKIDQEVLLELDYPKHLWMEKEIKSVANLTRSDVSEFLALAAGAGIHPEVEEFPLEEANRALVQLKAGEIRGAKVLRVE